MSNKNIHALRVSIRKFEAILDIANIVNPSHRSKKTILMIKKIRKKLGPFRDVQVQLKAIKKYKNKKLNIDKQHPFFKFLSEKKIKAKKKSLKCLNQISLKDEKNNIKKMIKKTAFFESNKNKKQTQIQLNSKIKSSITIYNQLLKNINPERSKEIHKLRILTKKLRYESEFINLLIGHKKIDLKKLIFIQNITGKIQNNSSLIQTIDQFLKNKKNNHNFEVLKIRKEIQNHQSIIIQNHIKQLTVLK